MSRVKPRYNDSDSDCEDELDSILTSNNNNDENDDFSSLSFAALSSAQEKLRSQNTNYTRTKSEMQRQTKSHEKFQNSSDSESASNSEFESDSEPETISTRQHGSRQNSKGKENKSKNKHAPAESSSKKPVSTIRDIPGLKSLKGTSLYKDIRFDAAYGKADLSRIRKDYAFLDEYREKEIADMKKTLRDRKALLKMPEYQQDKLKMKLQSLQSRLDTLKNRDLSDKIIADHKKEQIMRTKTGQQTNPYFLKKSEQRKMIQKAKFDTMKASQREKVMERKRKRRLGKEFKQLEFRGQGQ